MPRIELETIAEAVVNLMDSNDASTVARAIAGYMVSERRTTEINALTRKVKKIYERRFEVIEADITSRFPLDRTVIDDLKAIITTEQKVIVNQQIDKGLIGGVRVEANGKMLDLSVRSQLNQLKSGVKI